MGKAGNPNTPRGKPKNRLRVAGAFLLFLFEKGLGMMGYTNPSLGWMLWGAGAVLLWWAFCTSDWSNSIIMKLTHGTCYRIAGVLLIFAFFGPASYFSPWHKPAGSVPTNREVVAAVRDASEHQADEVSKLRAEMSKKLDDYFANQPRDEKEKWQKYLTKEYPLGWGVYAADGNDIFTPRGLSYRKDFAVTWDTQRVSKLMPDRVSLQPPDIFVKGIGLPVGSITLSVKRQVGTKQPYLTYGNIAIVAEILEDEADFVVFAVGFREEK